MTDLPIPVALPRGTYSLDAQLWTQLEAVLQKAKTEPRPVERRCFDRYQYPVPFPVTPMDSDGTLLIDTTLVALGRQLSVQGLDFHHAELLPYQRVVVTLELADRRLAILMHLHWCRFHQHGWYGSGGRFLKKVDPPALPARIQRELDELRRST